MLILLPPSEGKRAPQSGASLDLDALAFPELDPIRRRVLAALTHICDDDPSAAAALLGLGPTQQADVAADARLASAPCRPAISVYSGVLYEALHYPGLSTRARSRARSQLAIASGLWGLVRPTDRIPYYRLSGSVSLPGVGTLASAWKDAVSTVVGSSRGLIVDLRSGGYVALGPIPADATSRTVTVRVLQEKDGRRTVVSHHNKATKGLLVRSLLEADTQPRTPAAMLGALAGMGFRVEAGPESRAGSTIQVIVAEP